MDTQDKEKKCMACSCSCGAQQEHNHPVEKGDMKNEKETDAMCTGSCACDDEETESEGHCGCC